MAKKIFIYNLFPKLVGHINNWYKHIERIKYMGFNYIYINPLHYPGFSGSLYSPKDYYKFNPQFFGSDDFNNGKALLKNFINYCHNNNIKILFDLVINHTAIDSVLIEQHPAWYKYENGKIANPYAMTEKQEKIVWGDLAEIDNYNSKDKYNLWNYWLNLIFTFADMGVDGFRADAAYKVPTELWNFLISKSKSRFPHLIYLAETLGCTPTETLKIAKSGFDFIFNSSKYWDFHSDWLIGEQYNLTRETVASISFPESHDTERLYKEVNKNLNEFKIKLFFTSFFSTGVMIPIGFEYCFYNKLDVVTTKPENWEFINHNIINLIKDILYIKNSCDIFKEECYQEVIKCSNPKVFLMKKISNDKKSNALIALNLDSYNYQHIEIQSLKNVLSNKQTIIDISPEYPFEVYSDRFEYYLRPGQMKLFFAQ
ncbi:MAG TPA: alpha-amylase family glycosyl hydrolase [bacterium]|nr:alpha-amylase family glycosyl hydrolase [bacterium]HOL46727.1 alpha-amylase family glycosyl hydrolase [bacterium]HPQ18163.1 alpha-amylase family glycosyl hydrolase [bacterium]